jgi:hypothetical protein
MSRQEILGQIEEAFGSVPGWFSDAPDAILEQLWTSIGWVNSDSALSGREKVLVAFGAAAAIHCEY